MKDRMGKDLTGAEIVHKAANRGVNILLDAELLFLNWLTAGIPLHSVRKFFFRLAGVKIGKDSFIHMHTRF